MIAAIVLLAAGVGLYALGVSSPGDDLFLLGCGLAGTAAIVLGGFAVVDEAAARREHRRRRVAS